MNTNAKSSKFLERSNSTLIVSCLSLVIVGVSGCASSTVNGKNSNSTEAMYIVRRTSILESCTAEANKYRSSTQISQNTQFIISLVGVAAGSIAVPALAAASVSKAIVAAVGGMSGGVNGLQLSWNKNGFSATGRAQAYKQFGDEVKKLLANIPYNEPQNDNEKAAANQGLEQLRWYCLGQAPIADLSDSSDSAEVAKIIQKSNELAVNAQLLASQAEKARRDADSASDQQREFLKQKAKELADQAMQAAASAKSASDYAQQTVKALSDKAAADAKNAAEAARHSAQEAESGNNSQKEKPLPVPEVKPE